jgi:UDP-N-acetylmuramoyl-L-alanyl-D-glutamate--2,6-diaminopimelate ligase
VNGIRALPAQVKLSALLQGECELPAGFDRTLSGIQLDSRRIQPGDLFVACKGGAVDGRDFIPGAIAGGAAAVLMEADSIWQEASQEAGATHTVPLIPVVGLPHKLGRVAARFYGEPAADLRLIGITGTNGKTSCCLLVAQALTALGYRCGVIGTLGHGIAGRPLTMDKGGPSTTPDPVRLQQLFSDFVAQDSDTVVMEVSSHGLDQHRVEVDDFSAAVFTNLTRDHLDYHGSMAAYGDAKRRLFSGRRLQVALLNRDDPFSARILEALPKEVRACTWSLRDPAADVHASELHCRADGIELHVTTPWGSGVIRSRLFGSFNASNLLAVLATVLACEARRAACDAQRIMQVIGALEPVQGRMETIRGYPVTVVVDYAHTPDGLENALAALREHFRGALCCVFGCGGDRDPGKRPLMAAIAGRLADTVVVTDDNPRHEPSAQIIEQILPGFSAGSSVQVVPDRARAIRMAIDSAEPGSVVLIAGKGHEDYQEVAGVRSHFSDIEQARHCLQLRFQRETLQ